MINTVSHPSLQLHTQYRCTIDNNGVKALFRDLGISQFSQFYKPDTSHLCNQNPRRAPVSPTEIQHEKDENRMETEFRPFK